MDRPWLLESNVIEERTWSIMVTMPCRNSLAWIGSIINLNDVLTVCVGTGNHIFTFIQNSKTVARTAVGHESDSA